MTTQRVLDRDLPASKDVRLWSMSWVVWRQHRFALFVLLGLCAGPIAYMAIQGRTFRRQYDTLVTHHCFSGGTSTSCATALDALSAASTKVTISNSVLFLLPLIVGMFIGAPLVAREFETGTFRFVWTQEIGRVRWLAAELLIPATALWIVGSGVGLVAAWFASPVQLAGQSTTWRAGLFDPTAVTLPGWMVLAFVAGVLVGSLVKGTVPAIATTGVALLTIAGLTYWRFSDVVLNALALRTHGTPQVLGVLVFGSPRPVTTQSGVLILSQWVVDPNGQKTTVTDALRQANYPDLAHVTVWLAQHHLSLWWSYQPSGHLVLLQTVETGAALVLTALLTVGCFVRISSRVL